MSFSGRFGTSLFYEFSWQKSLAISFLKELEKDFSETPALSELFGGVPEIWRRTESVLFLVKDLPKGISRYCVIYLGRGFCFKNRRNVNPRLLLITSKKFATSWFGKESFDSPFKHQESWQQSQVNKPQTQKSIFCAACPQKTRNEKQSMVELRKVFNAFMIKVVLLFNE